MSQLMKRRIIVGAIVLNILTVIFPFAANAAGPTLKATRIGQKVVWRGSVYIAVSVKGKIVWKLVGKLGVNSPSSAPSQSQTSSPSASPTISELPKPSVSENTSSAPSNISDPVAPLRPDLGVSKLSCFDCLIDLALIAGSDVREDLFCGWIDGWKVAFAVYKFSIYEMAILLINLYD